jgi:electron transport complex protein RnfB
MFTTETLIALIILGSIGLGMSLLLSLGKRIFAVETDDRFDRLMDVLPGANCGGCGFPGCSGYAQGLIDGVAKPTACPPGGPEVSVLIGEIMGVAVVPGEPMVAVVCCAGDHTAAPETGNYQGLRDCRAAHAVAGGTKSCSYGCLGLGSCRDVCVFGAIDITENGLVVIDRDKCTACGACLEICPRHIIRLVPKRDEVHVLCVNPDKAKAVKEVCTVGCTACKLCNKQSSRLIMNGQLAIVDPDSKGEIPPACALSCPQGTIVDLRETSLKEWITDPQKRKDFAQRQETWKEEEKARKAAAREKKEARKETNRPASQGGEA